MNTIYFLFFAVFLGAYITLLCMLLAHPFSKGRTKHNPHRNDVSCGDNSIMPATPEPDGSYGNGGVVTPGLGHSIRD